MWLVSGFALHQVTRKDLSGSVGVQQNQAAGSLHAVGPMKEFPGPAAFVRDHKSRRSGPVAVFKIQLLADSMELGAVQQPAVSE